MKNHVYQLEVEKLFLNKVSEYGIKNIMGIVNNFIIHICIGVKGIKELNMDLNNLLEK